MPEWALSCYMRMLPRLEATQSQRWMEAALATNDRMFSDTDRQAYLRSLDVDREPPKAVKRSPKQALEFLQRAGVKVGDGKEVKE